MATRVGPTRNLHWVFKVADRTATVEFLQKTLGMQVLRHEEFEEGCAAACNGPYNGRWSKTMIGYGPEDTQFVLELTYNYEVKHYELGNDYQFITISSREVYDRVQAAGIGQRGSTPGGVASVMVTAPGGYRFCVLDRDVPAGSTVMTELCLNVSDLSRSLAFWNGFLGFHLQQPAHGSTGAPSREAVLLAGPSQAALRLQQLDASGSPVARGSAFGRVAFAAPGDRLQQLEADVRSAGYTVHTPYVSLDTPGKATVQVVILQDPDGHEICFVGDEGFRELSQVDPEAGRLLADAVAADDSVAWLAKQAAREAAMAAKGV